MRWTSVLAALVALAVLVPAASARERVGRVASGSAGLPEPAPPKPTPPYPTVLTANELPGVDHWLAAARAYWLRTFHAERFNACRTVTVYRTPRETNAWLGFCEIMLNDTFVNDLRTGALPPEKGCFVIVHEYGHAMLSLPDEYDDPNDGILDGPPVGDPAQVMGPSWTPPPECFAPVVTPAREITVRPRVKAKHYRHRAHIRVHAGRLR